MSEYRPPPHSNNQLERKRIYLDKELVKSINHIASIEGNSFSVQVEILLLSILTPSK